MDKRKKIIFIVLIVILSVAIVYDKLYTMLSEQREAIEDLRDSKISMLKKYKSAISRSKDLEKSKEEVEKKAQEINSYIINEQTDSLAAAQVQSALGQIIQAYGGNLRRSNVKKTEKLPPYQIVIMDVDLSVPNITALNDIVYEIEKKTPVLLIKKLDIKIVNYANPVDLSVNMDISALAKM
ncbi:MAG: type II secretion system protein GspM [Candidatus Magnetoovum sp. WYHC-5]|nr:type II secretion system protein GspM [Candidatus Magnetoovum sp. WYHC-5]